MGGDGTEEPGKGGALGICLSGGGFRAALYGLGVLRYLAEAGLLRSAAVVCGVSGGSIAAAGLANGVKERGAEALDHDGFVAGVYQPFFDVVTKRSLRDEALKRWARDRLLLRGRPRNLVIADALAAALFPSVDKLNDLPERPQLVITATELAVGRAFRFSRDFVGSWDFDYGQTPATMRVATAVGASAAAPPAIPALQLETEGLGLNGAPATLSITDGGVYDNLGLEWFQGWSPQRRPDTAVPADDLMIVNASGPLERSDSRKIGVWVLNRSRQIQYAQTQATRVRWLVAQMLAGEQRGAYFGIVRDPREYTLPDGKKIDKSLYADALPSVLVPVLAALRTDLNQFSADEASLLAYHGYHSTYARLASLRPDDALAKPSWREYAGMSEGVAASLAAKLGDPRRQRGIDTSAR